jgi:FixJ family two-component response regulator
MSADEMQQRAEGGMVYVVDDDPGIRDGIGDLLDSLGIASRQFESCERFLAEWRDEGASCLVLDVRLQGMTGVELQEQLAVAGIPIPIIFMTAYADVPMVRKVLKAGAVEFLIKPFEDEELLKAVKEAFARDRAQRRAENLVNSIQARAETLSERERQVMELVTAGLTNKEIAEKLFLSVVTIKVYRGQVMRKMEAESLADLVRMYEKISPPNNSKSSTV